MSTVSTTTQQDDPLLDAGQVAAMLGVTRSWVYEQSRQRRIPTVTLGRYRRYRRSSVLRWIAELEGERASSAGGRR